MVILLTLENQKKMRSIKNPEDFRKNVCLKLEELFKSNSFNDNNDVGKSYTNICLNLEKGVFNYAIQEAEKKEIVKKWDNVYFTQFYVDKMRSIITNLEIYVSIAYCRKFNGSSNSNILS